MKRPATKGDSSPPAKTHSSSGRFFNIDIDAGDFSDLFNPFLHTAFTRANGSGGHSGGHSSSSSSGATSSGGSGGSGSSSANGGSAVPSSKVLELEVSLEELLTGVTKHVRLSTGAGSGGSASAQEHVMNVEVKKGWHEGTRITFPGAGLKAGGGSSSGGGGGGGAAQDIVFVVKEKKHSHFRREGSNLLYTAEITLREVRLISQPVFFFVAKTTWRAMGGWGAEGTDAWILVELSASECLMSNGLRGCISDQT